MSLHRHELAGCAPAPLAHYLKALGILRLVSEQADSGARGFWRGERFCLVTTLSSDELESFLLERYVPTPLVSPWLKGSGFYNQNDPGLNPIRRSLALRLAVFRTAIADVDSMLAEIQAADSAIRAIKEESKQKSLSSAERSALRNDPIYKARLAAADREFKRRKGDLFNPARRNWRGPQSEWMNAALVLDDRGEPSYPALLGTGGNDGRLDFTNNFMQQLQALFDVSDPAGRPNINAKNWLQGALWSGAHDRYQKGAAIGQFAPGAAGGPNSSNGCNDESLVNPFDFVLMFEGAICMRSSAANTLQNRSGARAAAPFAPSSESSGFVSASLKEDSARGEQWMPLWTQPLSYFELRQLLAEGRAQMGKKTAAEPFDFARAVARMGTARGVVAFQRFGYIERNGQANLAVPLGRFVVPDSATSTPRNLDDLEAWLLRLKRVAHEKETSICFKTGFQNLANDALEVAQQPDNASRWQSLLIAAAKLEAIQASGTGFIAGPIPTLRAEWVEAANDDTAEFRLALAFASQAAEFPRFKAPRYPVRLHFQTLNGHGRLASSGRMVAQRQLPEPQVVVSQQLPIDNCIAIVNRRLVDRTMLNLKGFPLRPKHGFSVSAADLALLLTDKLNLDRTLLLARAFCALSFDPIKPKAFCSGNDQMELPDDAWMVIRLSLLPWPLIDGKQIPADPAIARRLSAGDAAGAFSLARARLAAHGIHASVRQTSQPPEIARRWAAALAFPISQRTAQGFLKRIDPNFSAAAQPQGFHYEH